MAEVEKILTDTPYLDELVYCIKLLTLDTVLKNQTEADEAETLESSKAANLYLACKDDVVLFDELPITLAMLQESSIDPSNYDSYLLDYNNIPQNEKNELMAIAKRTIIQNYEELNNYYRNLAGLPNIGDPGIKLTDWEFGNNIIIDKSKYIHEMNNDEIEILYSVGILSSLIKANPSLYYLRHLGKKRIDPYTARKAARFEPIYIPDIKNIEIHDRYKSRLYVNRVYTLKTIYSEAYKYGSDYYDNFISILIVIQTALDIIGSLNEIIARREIFDISSIQYIFQSYGIPYYSEIPLKYQTAMVKNINTLIKYKSTTKNIVDICSLFGFDNIAIFKFYLLKYKNMNNVNESDQAAELKFIRVPLEDDNVSNYLKDKNNHIDYDEITAQDKSWDGDLDHEYVKSKILEKEFNYLRTKYIAIDTVYDITQLTFSAAYFYNILFDNKKLEENLIIFAPMLNTNDPFRLTDIFCYLFALAYIYNGIEDDIMDTTGKVLHVLGFNFQANLAEIASYVQSKGFTMQELGVSGFVIPNNSIMSYNQLIDIFVKNSNIRDHVINQMINADNKRIYDIYKYLHDALMITEFNNNYFRDPDTGEMPRTYTDYLQRRNSTLYASLIEIKEMENEELKMQRISFMINNIIYALDEYLDSDTFRYIYNGLPSASGDHIKDYIEKFINFFKSYKLDMLKINTIYQFGNSSSMENYIKIIDDIYYKDRNFTKEEFIQIMDTKAITGEANKIDQFEMFDKMYLFPSV